MRKGSQKLRETQSVHILLTRICCKVMDMIINGQSEPTLYDDSSKINEDLNRQIISSMFEKSEVLKDLNLVNDGLHARAKD